MSSSFQLLEEACQQAIRQGLRLGRGATFIWEGDGQERLVGCNATGALLWRNCLEHSQGLADLCRLLGQDTWWLHRFWLGWDQGNVLRILDPISMKELGKDPISAEAARMSRRFFSPNGTRDQVRPPAV